MGKALLSVTQNPETIKEKIEEDFNLFSYIAFFYFIE